MNQVILTLTLTQWHEYDLVLEMVEHALKESHSSRITNLIVDMI